MEMNLRDLEKIEKTPKKEKDINLNDVSPIDSEQEE